MASHGKMSSYGNKYALADQTWEKVEGGFSHKSMFKMVPSVHVFNPMKKYLVTLNNGISYTGLFRFYVYKKETMDSPLIRVYIELKLDEGVVILPEVDIQGFVRVQ